jgi:putative transposase
MLEKDHPELSLKVQAELLGLSYASLFYQPVPPSPRELAIKRRIDEVYTAHPYYGSHKITVVLRSEFDVSRPTVQAYMREMGLAAVVPGPYTSKPAPQHLIYPYLLRHVTASHANHIWGIDITYIRLPQGWLYLTAVLDWYSRYVLSWALSRYFWRHPRSGIVTKVPISPAPSIWSACKKPRSKSAWMAVAARAITSLPSGSGAPSNTKKSTCMTMLARRRLIDNYPITFASTTLNVRIKRWSI